MYIITITRKAELFLKKIPKSDAAIIVKKIYSLRDNPQSHLKKLAKSYKVPVELVKKTRKPAVQTPVFSCGNEWVLEQEMGAYRPSDVINGPPKTTDYHDKEERKEVNNDDPAYQ